MYEVNNCHLHCILLWVLKYKSSANIMYIQSFLVCVFLVIIPEMANSAYGIFAANRFSWEVILRLVLC